MVHTEVKLVVQCIKLQTYRKNPASAVFRKIIYQINAKCGGTNVNVDWPAMPLLMNVMTPGVLLLGVAINNQERHGYKNPSIAAMVGVIDIEEAQYTTRVLPQCSKTRVLEMKYMMRYILAEYYEKTGGKEPQRIIVYRVGLPKTCFQSVLASELHQILEAYRDVLPLFDSPVPKITYIVCKEERYQIRLVCEKKNNAGIPCNVPPGTVVDQYITDPTLRDFYFYSQEDCTDTSRPMQYIVLWDENDLSMNQLQMLTYTLCHLDSRCANAVSLPMPAVYALLAAEMVQTQVPECEELHLRDPEGDPVSAMKKSCFMEWFNKQQSTLYFL